MEAAKATATRAEADAKLSATTADAAAESARQAAQRAAGSELAVLYSLDDETDDHVQTTYGTLASLVETGAISEHTGACGYNRPCAHQYVGKYQSCMV